MRIELDIIGLLSREHELTINQISKKLGESYAFVHRKVNELVRQNVISKRTIGPCSVCTLNHDSERAQILLQLYELEEKERALQKNESDDSLITR